MHALLSREVDQLAGAEVLRAKDPDQFGIVFERIDLVGQGRSGADMDPVRAVQTRFESGLAQAGVVHPVRSEEGKLPGCVEACPAGALVFGTRREVIAEANRRIYQNPGKYNTHIYGEQEAGGTSWVYISAVPFEQIGFRTDIGNTAYPEYTTGFLYAVPFILLLWPTAMLGMNRVAKKEDKPETPVDKKE